MALDLITSTGDSEADANGIYEGDITFLEDVTYTEAGTYVYLIRETIPEPKRGGMTYDESVYRVTVVVTDDGNGTLTASNPVIEIQKTENEETTYETVDSIVFKNTYVPKPVTVIPYEMTKVLVGKRNTPLQENEFQFEKILVSADPADGVILPNPSVIGNDADGKVQFNDITFTKAGTYVIQIREVIPKDATENADGTFTKDGITYDTHVVQSTFKVTDDENGTLTVVRTSTIGSREFRNEYKSDGTLEGAANLKVTKNFTGRAWEDGDSFTFILEGKNEATNTAIAEGKVVLPDKTEITIDYDDKEKSKAFGDIVFYEAGTYEFAIREAVPEEPIPGVDYDATSRTIVVTAVDNGTGELTVTATGGTNPTFNNVYRPDDVVLYGHGNLHVIKTFTGRENDEWLDSDAFKFTITPKAGVTADAVTAGNIIMPTETTLTVNKDNKEYAHFGNITFKKVGEYEFVVTEEVGNIPGVTYTTVSKTVKVNVTNDSENGVLLVAMDEQSDELEFVNTYSTKPVELTGNTYLKVTKVLSGRNWRDSDEFTFTLAEADDVTKAAVEAGDVVLPSEKELTVNKTEMSNAFGDITFKKPGAYAFTIKEVKGDIDGVTYDGHTATVSVMVVDNKEGQLVIAATDVVTTGSMTWENVYTPDPINLSLEALKKIDGRDWDAAKDIYIFSIVAVGDNASKAPLPEKTTVQNATDGKIIFETITYTEAGEYKYVIYENGSNVAGVTTDKGYVVANVTVTNDADRGELVSSVVYTKVNGETRTEGLSEFVNTYSSTGELDGSTYLKVTKDFTGRPDNEWLDTDEFKFTLAADTSDEATQAALKDKQIVMPTEVTLSVNKTNKDHAYFGNIKFTKAGTYQFIVTEQNDGRDGVTYDTTPKTVIVTVVDNWDGTLTATATGSLTFTNVYSASGTLEGRTNLKVTKDFTGRPNNEWRTTDVFTFVLQSADDVTAKAIEAGYVVMPADKDGITIDSTTTGKTKAFGDITFTKEGTYKFIIREVKPTQGAIVGVEYDGTPREITVTVNDNGDATMDVVAVVTSGTSLTFKNVYKTGEITLSGHNNLHVVKNLTGREWLDTDAFKFTLKADETDEVTKNALNAGNIVMPERDEITITKDNKDRIHFGDIIFKAVGTYKFIVKEEIPDGAVKNADGTYSLHGITYDATPRVVEVNVVDNHDGTLTASMTDESEELAFTNVYDAGSVTTYLKVTKKLTGRDWFEADEFEFTLEAADDVTKSEIGKSIIMPANKDGITIDGADKDKEAAFGDIIFTEPGTYKFIIQEVIPEETNKIAGITYDSHKVTVEVVVTDNHKGQLVAATPVYSGSMEFENIYTPEKVSAEIKGWKIMDGRDLKESDRFEFTISVNPDSPSNIPMPGKTIAYNEDDGAITFGTITYSEAGTYVYDIKETGGKAPGVTNDKTTVTATVKITYDASTGELSEPVVTYSRELKGGFLFENKYKAGPTDPVTIFNAKKTVTPSTGNSYAIKGGEFEFKITPDTEHNPSTDPISEKTVSNDKNGSVIFASDVKYTESGTYYYTVREVDGNLGGMSYDGAVYEIKVVVTDNEDTAKLSAAVTITKTKDEKTETVNAITFDNGYNPDETTATISGTKKLTGSKKLEANEFSFEIKKTDNSPKETPMPEKTTVKNTVTGDFQFGTITYTVPGEYSYIISEVNEGKTGYTYDDATYTVTVKVTDENGKLKAEVSQKEDIVFENKYKPNPITLQGETALKGTKKLDGRTMKANEFIFQLIGEDNEVVLESKNDADGNFTFEPLTFTEEGTYKYTIVEKNTGLGGVTYDTNSYAVTVEVTDVEGSLTAKVSYYDEDEKASVVFKNAYAAQSVTQQITATKKLTGRDLKAGEFAFVLKDESGKVVATAKNDANGVIVFEGITYDKAGTYNYTISEEKGQTEYVTYDESVYNVTVTVKDGLDGHMEASVEYEGGAVVFTNAYREPVVPTNDTIFSGGYVVTALIALATAVVAFFKRKRIVK